MKCNRTAIVDYAEKRNKTVTAIASECSLVAQKWYKNRHDKIGNVIHWKLYQRFDFDYITKWKMQKLESVKEN